MSPYDSDSSVDDGDAGSGVDTGVLLGYASTEPSDDSISQLGGQPSWLDPAQPPSASLARCRSCNRHLALLLQLNADLPERYPRHERRLYIWACRKKACRRKPGSIRAVRGVRVSKQRMYQPTAEEEARNQQSLKEAMKEQKANVGATLFGGSSSMSSSQNPFSSASASSNPFSSPSAQSSVNPFATAPPTKEDVAPKKKFPDRFATEEEFMKFIDSQMKNCRSVSPDIVGFDGHTFAISTARGVPQEITEKFHEFITAEPPREYEDLPPELLAYEDPNLVPDSPPLTARNYPQGAPPGVPADYSDVFPETFAQKARISDVSPPATIDFPIAMSTILSNQQQLQHIPWPTDPSELPKPYPSYHLDADYEYLSPKSKGSEKGSGTAAAFMDIEKGGDDGGSTSGGSKEKSDEKAYEDALDRTFQHFADTVAQNPEQVLRYEFGGSPLLYSKMDRPGNLFPTEVFVGPVNSKIKIGGAVVTRHRQIPRCGNCGSDRVFECQLTPHAITELEADEEAATSLGDGMEWGTILVCVCSADCGGDEEDASTVGYVEEWVGVQWEEIVNRNNYSGSGKGRLEFED